MKSILFRSVIYNLLLSDLMKWYDYIHNTFVNCNRLAAAMIFINISTWPIVYCIFSCVIIIIIFGSVCLLCSLFRLYWKLKYVSRLQYLWDDIKKGEIEIPEFVRNHDDILEHRPLTDYGIEPDPFHLTGMPSVAYSFGKYEERWAARDYVSEYDYRWIILWVRLLYRIAQILYKYCMYSSVRFSICWVKNFPVCVTCYTCHAKLI